MEVMSVPPEILDYARVATSDVSEAPRSTAVIGKYPGKFYRARLNLEMERRHGILSEKQSSSGRRTAEAR